ncbi:hypothetical protein GCM10022220_00330 [Actinocatenispora rupis]|uniref:Uncharacterized protein n=1 Tax=Actinocatenispora rupis TaxID=519421 RepID=A0A8J3JDS3_9ACTN|nr:hypothetical protein Aru02nite_49870 [Actinocatenispora rupis]
MKIRETRANGIESDDLACVGQFFSDSVAVQRRAGFPEYAAYLRRDTMTPLGRAPEAAWRRLSGRRARQPLQSEKKAVLLISEGFKVRNRRSDFATHRRKLVPQGVCSQLVSHAQKLARQRRRPNLT